MKQMNAIPILMSAAMLLGGCDRTNGQTEMSGASIIGMAPQGSGTNPYYSTTAVDRLEVSQAEWKKILPSELYHVAFEKGTERPFTGKFKDGPTDGTYRCAVCGFALFDPGTKFDSGTGWPSFYRPIAKGSVADEEDRSLGMTRDEVLCGRCGAHLGHVFDDGPPPTGLRYCINAVSLDHTSE